MAESIFDSDPTEIPASQRMANAHAELIEEPLSDADINTEAETSEVHDAEYTRNEKQAVRINGLKSVDLNDEAAFPSLGGGTLAKPKSLWGSTRVKMAPIASQVVTATDLITETVKLEAAQQQPRSLGKNVTADVVKSVQRSTETAIQMSTGKTGTTTFLIKGKSENVTAARRALMKELGKKIVLKLSIPGLVRPYIIGSKGRTLKAIIDRTGARIQLPKRDDAAANAESEAEEQVELTIEGDMDGANAARKEIEAIVAERTSSTSVRVESIPFDFHGLISFRLAELSDGLDTKIKIPAPSSSADVSNAITISGEKGDVAECKRRLESLYEDLKTTTIPTAIPVPKRKHQFVISAIPEILKTSGCAVTVPSQASTSEQISIRGLAQNIGIAITMVMDNANSMAIESLEISRAHASAKDQLGHAINLTKYLQSSKKLSSIEKDNSVSIKIPTTKEMLSATRITYDINGKSPESVTSARKQIIALINTLTPDKVLCIEIEPLLHKQVMGPKSKNINHIKKQNNVDFVFPAATDGDTQVVCIYDGSANSVDDISSAMQAAKKAINDLVAEAGEISSETVSIPAKYHNVIVGKNNTTLNAITGGSDAVVRVLFAELDPDSITVKGPKKDVDRVIKDLQTIADDATTTESASSHTIEFNFPPQFTKNLIGKGGANISKIRDELGVKIDIGEEGRVTVQGLQRNAEEARNRINLLGERLLDETTYSLKVPAEFHGQIIGQGGKFVKRLEEKYQVQINFPRTGEAAEEDSPLGKNEISVKGGKKGASAAKQEIMELFEYEHEHSHTITIQVMQRAIAQIVGKNGITINEIKDETNTRIDIDRVDVETNGDSQVGITIKGKKTEVEKAKEMIDQINREVEDTITKTLNVDAAHHRNLIGPGGSRLRDLVVKAGGPDDASLRARMVRFPRAGVDSDEIVLRGPKKIVDKITKAIEKIVGDASSQHSKIIHVPKDQVRIVIGRNGSKKSELETTLSVTIDIPRASDAAETTIKVLGTEDNVDKAIQEILDLVKVPESETIQVPRNLHRSVADGGSFIRRLRSDLKVNIDHAGHDIPKSSPKTQQQTQSSGTARIDDDQLPDEFAFTIVESFNASETGDIPWVLKGDPAQIAKAKKSLLQAIQQAKSSTHTAFMTVPSSKHRLVIGQGGSVITGIREKSGTKIDVPKSGSGEVVTIKGSEEGCLKAKDLILEAVGASK